MKYCICCLIQACLLCLPPVSNTQNAAQQATTGEVHPADVILGVLEDYPGKNSTQSDMKFVRAVFKKNDDAWRAFPTQTKSYHDLASLTISYPKEVTWTIAFDGRNLGRVTGQTQRQYSSYSEIGIEDITSNGSIPSVGNKSVDYADYFSFIPVYRPLVAISQPNVSDPEQWKPAQPPPVLVAAAREQFRNKFPNVSNCRSPDENILRPWKYRDEDIHVTKAYASKNNWSLVELSLTGYACDGPYDGPGFVGQWYVIDPPGVVRFLGTDMWLVDAGDYDNDGKSEVLFSIKGYNKGGYRLFYQDFTRSAEFVFNYH